MPDEQASDTQPAVSPNLAAGFSETVADSAQLRELPKDVGVMLVSVGVLGFVMPGVTGAPALVAGGLVLWPDAFGQVDTWFRKRYPTLHRQSMKQIGRFLTDLDQRYPRRQD